MGDFDQGYYNSMDREYTQEALMPIRDIGVSIMATKDAIQPLVAKIREGASKVEIGFMGQGKGSIFSGQITPESIDKEQRQAIRLLAKVNKVELSTHATVGTGGFAGFSNRGFDDNVRVTNMNEIKRAIEFAADTAQGGAVTMHAQEFPRALMNIEKEDSSVKFLAHPREKEEASLYLVDEKTGDVVTTVRTAEKLHMPIYKKEGDKIVTNRFGYPIPEFDKVTRDGKTHTLFKTEEWDWERVKKETARRNAERKEGERELSPEEVYFRLQNEAKLATAKGEEIEFMKDYDDLVSKRNRYVEAMKLWKAHEDSAGPNNVLGAEDYPEDLSMRDLVKPREGKRSEILSHQIEQLDRQIASIEQKGLAQRERLIDFEKQIERVKPITEVGVTRSAESIAALGTFALDTERSKGLKKDLYVAPEGIFPDRYGAHPQELKNLIIKSREKMAADLLASKRASSMKEAQDLAERHIKATVDIGHVNVWKKYFQSNPGESIEQSNKRFNNWLLDEMKDLNKHKIIGHLHISDNFGYEDEHLTPGQGSAPIKEFVKLMKEAGVTDMVVEPGAQDPAKQYEALYGGWKLFGHSIYGVSAPGKKSMNWGQVEHNYFGQNSPPYFLFGEMALSEEYRGSPFWSGLGLE